MPIVNGHPAETGCYVNGHWGQYGPDRLADQAEAFGWCADGESEDYPNEGYQNDPRYWRRVADRHARHGDDREVDAWQAHSEAADAIERWLNDRTEDGYVWHWHDGEFFLSPLCDDPDGCTDETCAHWD